MRVVEVVPGVYEAWDGGMIAEFNVKQQGNIAATALHMERAPSRSTIFPAV